MGSFMSEKFTCGCKYARASRMLSRMPAGSRFIAFIQARCNALAGSRNEARKVKLLHFYEFFPNIFFFNKVCPIFAASCSDFIHIDRWIKKSFGKSKKVSFHRLKPLFCK
jgi:hypothetical protein